MPWNTNWPNGAVSVKTNEGPGLQNTAYIKATMGGVAVGSNTPGQTDHFWNVDPDLDGHHRYAKMPAYTVGGNRADPDFDNAKIQGVYYVKQKTATQSTFQQDFQTFFKNPNSIMQLLGIRAMGVFTRTGTAQPTQAQVLYSHNLKAQTATEATSGIWRNDSGKYTIRFQDTVPSANYLVLGGAVRDVAGEIYFNVEGDVPKTNALFKFRTSRDGANRLDPEQAWFIVFGG